MKSLRKPGTLALKSFILLHMGKVWKRRIPNGTYGAVGGRLAE
jgi:hypothetical protein